MRDDHLKRVFKMAASRVVPDEHFLKCVFLRVFFKISNFVIILKQLFTPGSMNIVKYSISSKQFCPEVTLRQSNTGRVTVLQKKN